MNNWKMHVIIKNIDGNYTIYDNGELQSIKPSNPLYVSVETYWRDLLSSDPRKQQETELSLDKAKEEQWEKIKLAREMQKSKGFMFGGIRFDGDSIAQTNISNASLAALVAKSADAPYRVEWTTYDNSVVTLDADGMLGLQIAMVQAGGNIHAYGTLLRRQIETAKTVADVRAVAWDYREDTAYEDI